MKEIEAAVDGLIQKHGTLRAAARVTGIDPTYLHRLRNGQKSNPSPAMLRKLGLVKVVIYRQKAHVAAE